MNTDNLSIVLWGAYGANYGDNIMLNVILNQLSYFNIKVIVFEKYGNIQIDEKYKIIKIPYYNFSFFKKIYYLRKYSKKNIIHLWGGGSNFTDQDGCGNPFPFLLIKLFGGKYGYLAIGSTNIKKFLRKLLARVMLRNATFISVRETYSRKEMLNIANKKLKIYVAPDLVYIYVYNLLKEYKLISIVNECDDPYICFTSRDLSQYLSNKQNINYLNFVCQIILIACKSKKIRRLIIICTDLNVDLNFCEKVKNVLDNDLKVEIIKSTNIKLITKILLLSDFTLSTRLHTSMLLEAFSIPCITLSYSKKIEYFYNEINENNYFVINNKIDFNDIKKCIEETIYEQTEKSKVDQFNLFYEKNIESLKHFDYLKNDLSKLEGN